MYPMQSPYYQNMSMNVNPVLPHQQIIQVNGKASVDTIQLAPNSSILVMDTSAPIVWMCVSDGIGKVTATPYDIVVHQEAPPVNMNSIEQRLSRVEEMLMEVRNESNDAKSNAKQSKSKLTAD